jgi:hypothetical protein
MIRFLLLVLIFCSISSFAQVTIQSIDLPQPGQEYLRSTSNNTNIDITQTGVNQVWDFRELTRSSRDTMIYQSVGQTPLFYQIMFNNPFNEPYKATEAKMSPDINMAGFLELTNNYLFSKNTLTEWNEVGIGTTISGAPLPTKYSNIKTKLKLPLNFNDSNSDDYEYLITVPTFGFIGQKGVLNYQVDGWGIIKIAGGSFEVLRVKTDIIKSDSVFVNLLGFGTSIPSQETIYEWYAKTEGYPVLTVKTQLGVITSIEFKDDLTTSIESQTNFQEKNMIYPNPVKNILHLQLSHDDLQITILDISGKIVMQPDQLSPEQLELSQLPKGIYFIKYSNDLVHEVKQFVKQ